MVPRPRMVSPVSTAGSAAGPSSRKHSESDVCPGVLSTRSSTPGGRDHVAAGQRLGAEHQRRVEGPDRRPGQLGEPARAARVVVVAVGEQDQLDRAAAGDPGQVRLVLLAGVDDHAGLAARGAQHPGVGALQGHRRRVLGQQHRGQRGDRAQLAVRGMGVTAAHRRGAVGGELDVRFAGQHHPTRRRRGGPPAGSPAARPAARPRPARPRCPAAPRARAGSGWSGPSAGARRAPAAPAPASGCHQVASTASVVCASACCPPGSRATKKAVS